MELRHLRYFIAVAEAENVTRAALKLHVSQPALSRQVRDLEAELGFALLVRSAKSVRLTEAGRVFLEEARQVLERVGQAVERARAADAATGEMHLGYAPSPTVELLPRALRLFQVRWPRVRVRLHDLSAEEIVAQLHNGRLHLALTVQPAGGALRGLAFSPLVEYPWCVAVPPGHRWARARAVRLEELRQEPLLGYTRQDYPDYYNQVTDLFRLNRQGPQFAEEHDSVTSLIAGVEAGRGVALLPSCVRCMSGPRLRLLPLEPAGAPIVVGVLSRARVSGLAADWVAAAKELGNGQAASEG